MRQGAIKAFGWRTYGSFKLRFFESPDVLMAAVSHRFKNNDLIFGNEQEAEEKIRKMEFPIAEEIVEFIVIKVEELGFPKEARLSEIEECLPGLDLELCEQSDAPRLFLSDDSVLDKFRAIRTVIFLSKPFLTHLRSDNDPERPLFFQMNFNEKNLVTLTSHWHEGDFIENKKYNPDARLDYDETIILRVKQ